MQILLFILYILMMFPMAVLIVKFRYREFPNRKWSWFETPLATILTTIWPIPLALMVLYHIVKTCLVKYKAYRS